jgi:hypothetical protein
MNKIQKLPYESYSSMHYDFNRGRKTEVDSLTGYVVKLGKELSVPTPIHEKLLLHLSYTAPESHSSSENGPKTLVSNILRLAPGALFLIAVYALGQSGTAAPSTTWPAAKRCPNRDGTIGLPINGRRTWPPCVWPANVNGRGSGCRLQRWSSAIYSRRRPCKVPSPSSNNRVSRNCGRSWVIRQRPSPSGYSGPDWERASPSGLRQRTGPLSSAISPDYGGPSYGRHCGMTRATFYVTRYPKARRCGDSGAILNIVEQDRAYPHCGPGRGAAD